MHEAEQDKSPAAEPEQAEGPDTAAKPAQKDQAGKKKRTPLQREFLPAALEILDTPPNPLGRTIAIVVAAFFLIAAGWSYFAQIDVVAVAPATLVSTDGAQQVEPSVAGTVNMIHVVDGDKVTESQPVLTLDTSEIRAEIRKTEREYQELQFEHERFMYGLRHHRGEAQADAFSAAAPDLMAAMHRERANSEILTFEAAIDQLRAEKRKLAAEKLTIEQGIERLQISLPLLQEREQDIRQLHDAGHAAKPEWLSAKLALVEAEANVAERDGALAATIEALSGQDEEMERLMAEREASLLAGVLGVNARLEATRTLLQQLERRLELHTLRAPVNGTVQEVSVRTVGGYIEPGQVVMVVVPASADLMVKASIQHKDMGFVDVGQEVELKLEAYPFTRYGALSGVLQFVSRDAVTDPARGSFFEAFIQIDRPFKTDRDYELDLTSGMSVTADIKTGRRRVIEFLVSPLLRYRDESLRER
ncbi:MAG: HlyD family type I secretion periplasmic adaptor subunit [Pseudomonadota bacterium]